MGWTDEEYYDALSGFSDPNHVSTTGAGSWAQAQRKMSQGPKVTYSPRQTTSPQHTAASNVASGFGVGASRVGAGSTPERPHDPVGNFAVLLAFAVTGVVGAGVLFYSPMALEWYVQLSVIVATFLASVFALLKFRRITNALRLVFLTAVAFGTIYALYQVLAYLDVL
jgi:hypothetical protein